MNAGAMKVAAAGWNEMILIGKRAQSLHLLVCVGAIVGLQAKHTSFTQSGQPFTELFKARKFEGMGDDRQTVGAGDETHCVHWRKLVTRHIGRTAFAEIFVEGFANTLDGTSLH